MKKPAFTLCEAVSGLQFPDEGRFREVHFPRNLLMGAFLQCLSRSKGLLRLWEPEDQTPLVHVAVYSQPQKFKLSAEEFKAS